MATNSHSKARAPIPTLELNRAEVPTRGNQVPKMEPGSKTGIPEQFARRCLSSGIASSKEWAEKINVSDRLIRAWACGEKEIPDARLFELFLAAKEFCLRIRKIEDFLDRQLMERYGRNDDGRF